ncbi:MAG: hypothetical protein ACRC28_17135 [Clostridium sp.]|uniref:hypothetical protein n=1 Tax=Clostridium sp. TaxID=1506 RepID=UPI003F3AF2E4
MRITEDQFKRAYQSAGVGFICEHIKFFLENRARLEDRDEKRKIIEDIFQNSNDKYITGTRTRVNALLKIVQADRVNDGLNDILKSKRAKEMYPEALKEVEELLRKLN